MTKKILIASTEDRPAWLSLDVEWLPLDPNLSYGERQKAACRHALRRSVDAVLILTPDTLLTAENWHALVSFSSSNTASILLAPTVNRLLAGRAFKRRIYLFFARQLGRILGEWNVQDFLMDFTRPFRMYDTAFLRRVPFELNSDEQTFDIEMLFQAYALQSCVAELPASTQAPPGKERYFNARYTWDVMMESVRYRSQKIGFLCSMKYRGLLRHEVKYADKSQEKGSTHAHVFKRVPRGSRVLDMGCGPGFVSGRLKEKGCRVTGVDAVSPEHYPGDRFVAMDLEAGPPREDFSAYDYILLLDILEHLSNPEQFLIYCRYRLETEKRPLFIFSTANVAFIGIRAALGIGVFNYGERGILDVTHRRLFTLGSFIRMLRETGYEVLGYHGIGVPFMLLFPNTFGRFLGWVSSALARLWPSMWGYQIMVEARPKRR